MRGPPSTTRLFEGKPPRFSTIRARLAVTCVVIGLVAAGTSTLLSGLITLENARQEAVTHLGAVASLTQAELAAWMSELQYGLVRMRADPLNGYRLEALLRPGTPHEEYASAHLHLTDDLHLMVANGDLFAEMLVLDPQGMVVLSTNAAREGRSFDDGGFVQAALKGDYLQPPQSQPGRRGTPALAAHRIIDREGRLLGLLVGLADSGHLDSVFADGTHLGETTDLYLVGPDGIMLTVSRYTQIDQKIGAGQTIATSATATALSTHASGFGFYSDYRGVPVAGVWRWLPGLNIVLVAEEDQAEVLRPAFRVLQASLAAMVLALALAALIAMLLVRSITAPLAALSATATRIAAGELDVTAAVDRDDEIGALARTLNHMTGRLRALIGDLEQQVTALKTAQAEREQLLAEVMHERRHAEVLAAGAQQQADELNAVFRGITDMVIVSGATGLIVRANPAAVAGLGFDPTGLRRDEFAERLAARCPEGHQIEVAALPMTRALRGETVRGITLHIVTASGGTLVVRASASPLMLDGMVWGAVTVLREVTTAAPGSPSEQPAVA